MKCVVLWLLLLSAHVLRAADTAPGSLDTLTPLVQLLAASDDPQFQLDILKGVSNGLKGRRTVAMPAEWERVAAKLRASGSAKVRELTQSLSVMFGSATALAALRSTLLDARATASARSNALDTLLQVRDSQLAPALLQLLRDPAWRADALRGLGSYADEGIATSILGVYPSLAAREKNIALTTLSSRAPFARALLEAVSAQKVPARDLTADIVRQLRTLKDPGVNEAVAKAWGVTRETEADKLKEIGRLKHVMQTKGYGDMRRGREVFNKVCQQCHTLFGEGGKVGPELTGANRNDLDYILQNIIDPNALIPNDYRTWNVDTRDDRSITGIVTRQDTQSVTIVTATETLVIPRKEVQSMTQTELSLMPEGLLQPLTQNEVRDLLGYLRSPVQVSLPNPTK